MALAKLSIDIVAQLAKFEEDMRKAADETKGFRDKINSELEALKSSAGKFALGMAGGMAAAFSVNALAGWITHTTAAADELNRLSHQTGVSVEALSSWGNIAKRNGQDVNDLSELIQELSLRLTETDNSTEGTGLALKQLGLSYKDLAQMDAETAFKTVAQSLAGVEDSGKKTAMVMAIMGDEGQKYLTTLNAIGAAAELDASVTTQQAEQASRLRDTLANLSAAGDAWSQAVVAGITPALDEAGRALTDVISGSEGMTKEARRLAGDAKLAEWARESITALTYLMDIGQVTARSIRSIAQVSSAMVDNVSAGIFAVKQAASRAAEGDFSGAIESFQNYSVTVQGIDADLNAKLADTWNDGLFGSQIRNRMEQIKDSAIDVGKAVDTAKKSGQDLTLVKQNDDEYKKLIQGIRDKIVAMQQEQSVGAQLTSAEQERLATMRQIADGRTKLNAAQKAGVQAALNELVATEALTEAKREIAKVEDASRLGLAEIDGVKALTAAQQTAAQWMERLRDGRIRLSEEQRISIAQQWQEALATEEMVAIQKRTAAWLEEARGLNVEVIEQGVAKIENLREQIKAQVEQNAQWGLSAEALAGLQRARQLETAAALESRAAAMAGLESHAELVQQWTEQADAIRELVELQRQQAEMQRKAAEDPLEGARRGVQGYMDEIKRAGEAAEHFAGESLRGIEDALTDLATTGKADWKGLVNSMIAEAMRMQVIRPMMSRLLGGGSGGGGAAGGVIGLLGNLAGAKSGGGVDSFNSWEVDAGLSSGGGGSWFSSAASVLGKLFGRANGGPVQPGEMYQVNERGPELLTVGNRTMLMMGNDSGIVTPLQATAGAAGGGTGGASVVINQTFNFGGADPVTREDLRRTAAEAKSAALAEFANFRQRGVRGYT
ncbi:MAG: hypothetical protein RL654_101 [Pseudomonadota bacterium]|jgi:hypothetical protein